MVTCLKKMWSNWDIVIVRYNEDDLDEIQGPHVAMSLEWWESDWGSYLQLTSRRFHIGVLLLKYYNLSRMVGYTVCSLSRFFFFCGDGRWILKIWKYSKIGAQHGSTWVKMGQHGSTWFNDLKLGLKSVKSVKCLSNPPIAEVQHPSPPQPRYRAGRLLTRRRQVLRWRDRLKDRIVPSPKHATGKITINFPLKNYHNYV